MFCVARFLAFSLNKQIKHSNKQAKENMNKVRIEYNHITYFFYRVFVFHNSKPTSKRVQDHVWLQILHICKPTVHRCHLLRCELVCAHRDAVDELHGAPQAVELHALVHMHHTVGGRRPAPHPVLQEAADACQDDLEHGEAAAQTLFGQQVPLTGNGDLLVERTAMIFYY